MYSQYMDGRFAPLDEPHRQQNIGPPPAPNSSSGNSKSNALLGDLSSGLNQFLGNFGKQFRSGQFDTGDILLMLIILFLFLEGDNLELVITLGFMLLLGLQEDQSPR